MEEEVEKRKNDRKVRREKKKKGKNENDQFDLKITVRKDEGGGWRVEG